MTTRQLELSPIRHFAGTTSDRSDRSDGSDSCCAATRSSQRSAAPCSAKPDFATQGEAESQSRKRRSLLCEAGLRYAGRSRVAEQCIDDLLEGALASHAVASTPLTKREKQILQSILAGQTNKQIARGLCRSRRTIEYHRNQLMQKLNAHNAAELIRGAIEMGLVGQTV